MNLTDLTDLEREHRHTQQSQVLWLIRRAWRVQRALCTDTARTRLLLHQAVDLVAAEGGTN